MPVYTVGQLVTAANMNSMAQGLYRSTTLTAVANTVTETNLAVGAIAANVLGTDRLARMSAWGDWIQNSGSGLTTPRFKVKLGAGPTTVIDTGATTGDLRAQFAGYGWKLVCEVANRGATNSQLVNFTLSLSYNIGAGSQMIGGAFATGEGVYESIPAVGTTIGTVLAEGFNVSAIDTTASMNLAITTILPTATPTCQIQCYGWIIEIV